MIFLPKSASYPIQSQAHYLLNQTWGAQTLGVLLLGDFRTSPSRNLYNCRHSCFNLLLKYCCCIFVYLVTTFILLLLYFFVFDNLFMLVFVVVLSSATICKQVFLLNCLVFVSFIYNFLVLNDINTKHQCVEF